MPGFRAAIAATFLLAVSAAGTPAFGQDNDPEVTIDVKVLCDGDGTCVAAIPSNDSVSAPSSVLQIARTAQPDAAFTIAVTTLGSLADRTRPVSFSIDDGLALVLQPGTDYEPFVNASDFYITSRYALGQILADLPTSTFARFSYLDIGAAPHTDVFNLHGLREALDEIDRRQNREGAPREARPPVDLPEAPDIDRQALVALAGIPPRLLDWHLASSTCEAPDTKQLSDIAPIIGPLSPSAMLYAIPCYIRDGRPNYRLYLHETGEIGGFQTLYFASWSTRFGWGATDTLESVAYDSDGRRLTGVGRGSLAACPSYGTWDFEDYAFKLKSMRITDNCKGDGDPEGWKNLALP